MGQPKGSLAPAGTQLPMAPKGRVGGEYTVAEGGLRIAPPPMAPLEGSFSVSFTREFGDSLGLIACKFTTLFLYSYMLLFKHACVFFSRFLESRNYKIQIVAHVGGKLPRKSETLKTN